MQLRVLAGHLLDDVSMEVGAECWQVEYEGRGSLWRGRTVLLDVVLRLPDRHNGPRLGRVDVIAVAHRWNRPEAVLIAAGPECGIELLAGGPTSLPSPVWPRGCITVLGSEHIDHAPGRRRGCKRNAGSDREQSETRRRQAENGIPYGFVTLTMITSPA